MACAMIMMMLRLARAANKTSGSIGLSGTAEQRKQSENGDVEYGKRNTRYALEVCSWSGGYLRYLEYHHRVFGSAVESLSACASASVCRFV